MNCKNCGYGLKQCCGDFEKIICTYEEGECVKITELEKQIEKMKCCSNCIHLANCDLSGYEECKNFDKWELREIKEK
jgi:hypothetical protein